jgi:hypothetical protein
MEFTHPKPTQGNSILAPLLCFYLSKRWSTKEIHTHLIRIESYTLKFLARIFVLSENKSVDTIYNYDLHIKNKMSVLK